jgi:osmoprotectant transport system permease protein
VRVGAARARARVGSARAWAWAVVVALVLSCAPVARAGEGAQPRLVVGSKRFTESYILAEIAAGVARAAGDAQVSHQQGLGGTSLVFRALEEGSVDVYPEYTGTIAEAVLHVPGRADVPGRVDALRPALAARGIGISEPLGFDNTYGLAVPAKLAGDRHLETISDLARAPDLRFGLSHEFLGRSDGFPALAARYGLAPARVEALDHGLAYAAVARGALDVTDVYSTDAQIQRYGLTVLADDRRFFPSYEAVLLYREDAVRRAPRAMRAILALAGSIDTPTMRALNARAELEGQSFASIAAQFLRQRAGGAAGTADLRPSLLRGMLETVRLEGPRHVRLVGLAVLFATLVGVPLGVLASRARALGRFVLTATSVVQTIPSLALLCFFIPLLGTGVLAALAALFLYALLPITRNTLAGLDGIPPPLRESAEALGLGSWAQLVRVELPLASRTILAGIRTSAVIAVGTATLAAFIGAGGFGAPISTGLDLDDTRLILEGAIPAAALALVVEGLFALLDRTIIPKGLRLPAEKASLLSG